MQDTFYSVWCEYDFDQAGKIFYTEKDAWDWIEDAWNDSDIEEEYTDDLCDVHELEIILPESKKIQLSSRYGEYCE